MKITNSAIVYEGNSQIDGKPVVAIATGFVLTANTKLGSNVIQIWVLRSDISPSEALKSGDDYSVCGDCPLRGSVCYVAAHQAPTSIYKSYKKGNYSQIGDRQFQRMRDYNKVLRLTGYGDISAVPIAAVQPLIDAASVTIGYTHQFNKNFAQPYKRIVMASVESEQDARDARRLGWGTFRIKNSGDPLLSQEQLCTNQTNKAIQCEDCNLCDGKPRSIAVDVHGLNWKKQNFKSLVNTN